MARGYDDDRLVVIERSEGSSSIGMLLLGLAIGAGAALLLAPASGVETRERLSREARRAGRRMREYTDDLGERVADSVEQTRSTVDERVARARSAVRARVDAVSDAVEAGRDAVDDARADLERAVADAKRVYAEGRRAYGDRIRRPVDDLIQQQDKAADENPAED